MGTRLTGMITDAGSWKGPACLDCIARAHRTPYIHVVHTIDPVKDAGPECLAWCLEKRERENNGTES